MSGFDNQLEVLFEKAITLQTEAERLDYLVRACPDPRLRSEVQSLIAFHQVPDPVFTQETSRRRATENIRPPHPGSFVGQTLDGKYRLERFQGHGGMGAVYLSTHLGTGRFVAVKLIAPEFMRNQEFFQRFKREAQAAGRLRHPNIVDVTDFGIARVNHEDVAYLVMEYLDGCPLSEVLSEEKHLPLRWVVDILEQVSSAVHEAHEQGIIHRDLKPANIWLEPNTLGGYRVKVLDFGIAKLAEANDVSPQAAVPLSQPAQEPILAERSFAGDLKRTGTAPPPPSATPGLTASDRETVAARPSDMPTSSAEGLTRVGAILGTPAYMSPEQCRSQALDARSDIYSLGIIAYQMLSGNLPFQGDTTSLLEAHQRSEPPDLGEVSHKVPRAVCRLVRRALDKNPEARPPTANAFAQALRANAEDTGALYRRAFALYCEYFPQVIKLSLLAHIPVFILTALAVLLAVGEKHLGKLEFLPLGLGLDLLKGLANFVAGSIISGMIALIVVSLVATPLKPVTLRPTFETVRRHLRPLLRTGLNATIRILGGFLLLIVPGMVLTVRYCLWSPVVLLEGLQSRAALQRSRELAARSWRTCILATLFQVLVPMVIQGVFGRLISPASRQHDSLQTKIVAEITGLSSTFVMPLVSIVLALAYLKMRQLGGDLLSRVLPQIDPGGRALWEQRIRTRLSGKPRAAQ